MIELVFATNNKHKLSEAEEILGSGILLLNMNDIGCSEEIAETGNTLEENALIKARYVAGKYHCNCFADDTGLETEALEGAPGVFSARYAGEEANAEKNILKLMDELKGKPNRKARFRTVIALILDNKEYLFEGSVSGTIAETIRGTKGFGYDPVFIPEGSDISFAEMSPAEKNRISHRARALDEMCRFFDVSGR
jgi:XTP/dITP diphosphohydrolase